MQPRFSVSVPKLPPYTYVSTANPNDKIVCDNFNRDPSTFINKNTIIYGRTGSGKTTIVRDIMKILQPHFFNVFVVCPTMSSYDNYIPSNARLDTMDFKFLDETIQRQTKATAIYNNIQKYGIRVIEKYGTSEEKNIIANVKFRYEDKEAELNKHGIDPRQREVRMQILQDNYNRRLRDVSQHIFEGMRQELSKMRIPAFRSSLTFRNQSLTEMSFDIIRFYDINPKLLIIFDDVTGNFKEYERIKSQNNSPLFKDLFTKGRHINITTILTCHNDTAISPEIRGAVHVNIFAFQDSIDLFFERKNNTLVNVSNAAKYFKDEIFRDKTSHYKMIYDRDISKFFAYKAQTHPLFQLGSKEFWELAHKSEENNI